MSNPPVYFSWNDPSVKIIKGEPVNNKRLGEEIAMGFRNRPEIYGNATPLLFDPDGPTEKQEENR